MRTILFLATTLLLLVTLQGCAITRSYGPYHGKVIDSETKEPIEGAVVFMEFFTESPSLGGNISALADATEVLTDANGEFQLKYRVITFHPLSLWYPYPSVIIFKPGYGVFPDHKKAHGDPSNRAFWDGDYTVVNLPPLRTQEERRDNLHNTSVRSGVPYRKQKNIYKLSTQERVNAGLPLSGVVAIKENQIKLIKRDDDYDNLCPSEWESRENLRILQRSIEKYLIKKGIAKRLERISYDPSATERNRESGKIYHIHYFPAEK